MSGATGQARVRVTFHREAGRVAWLAPGTHVEWRYVDRPEDAGIWPWATAAGYANEYAHGQAWRGRTANLEPVPSAGTVVMGSE